MANAIDLSRLDRDQLRIIARAAKAYGGLKGVNQIGWLVRYAVASVQAIRDESRPDVSDDAIREAVIRTAQDYPVMFRGFTPVGDDAPHLFTEVVRITLDQVLAGVEPTEAFEGEGEFEDEGEDDES
jgi:hypothetical protein